MIVCYESERVAGEVQTREFSDPGEFFELQAKMRPVKDASLSIYPGSKVEALGLLRLLSDCVARGLRPPPLLANWFASAASAAIDSDEPERNLPKYLGLVRPRRGRPAKGMRDDEIYERMQELIDSGKSALDAKFQCASEFHLHEANVEKIYYLIRKVRESMQF